jgi:hypothetical protein
MPCFSSYEPEKPWEFAASDYGDVRFARPGTAVLHNDRRAETLVSA